MCVCALSHHIVLYYIGLVTSLYSSPHQDISVACTDSVRGRGKMKEAPPPAQGSHQRGNWDGSGAPLV